MPWLDSTYLILGGLIALFWMLFAVTSYQEKRPRAALVSVVILVGFGLLWFGAYIPGLPNSIIAAVSVVVVAFFLLFFLPLGRTTGLAIGSITKRVDERDTMFAREEYRPGTEKYNQYYRMRPELKRVDDRIRGLPGLLHPRTRYYEKAQAHAVESTFQTIAHLASQVDGPVASERVEVEPERLTKDLKRLIRDLGAADVGVAQLNQMFVYSHVGRGPEPWGTPIENNHRFAIAFTLEMAYERVEAAPDLPITVESARQYLRMALISVAVARYIRNFGYPARAHISDSNYQVILPPIANDAGLGELGRHGYLIAPDLGSRVRLGAITTDLPLITDEPIEFGVQEFCTKCRKCAVNCPPGAIPKGFKTTVRSVEKWQLDIERCIRYWRTIGTDCGLCMKVCPYSHPPTLVHNLVRAGIKRSAVARRISAWGDDVLYGRHARYPRFID
jgi:ferredoxin